jgi:hypothetical protein
VNGFTCTADSRRAYGVGAGGIVGGAAGSGAGGVS